jgi:hypothetical protein
MPTKEEKFSLKFLLLLTKLWVRIPPYTLVDFQVLLIYPLVEILVLCLSFVFAPFVDVLEATFVDNSQLVEEMVEFRESLADLFAVVFARCQVLVQLKNNFKIKRFVSDLFMARWPFLISE